MANNVADPFHMSHGHSASIITLQGKGFHTRLKKQDMNDFDPSNSKNLQDTTFKP